MWTLNKVGMMHKILPILQSRHDVFKFYKVGMMNKFLPLHLDTYMTENFGLIVHLQIKLCLLKVAKSDACVRTFFKCGHKIMSAEK